jgi:hypothetical protein
VTLILLNHEQPKLKQVKKRRSLLDVVKQRHGKRKKVVTLIATLLCNLESDATLAQMALAKSNG